MGNSISIEDEGPIIVPPNNRVKVYLKSKVEDDWEEAPTLYCMNISETAGQTTGFATLQFATQDEDYNSLMRAEGLPRFKLLKSRIVKKELVSDWPENFFVRVQDESAEEPLVLHVGVMTDTQIDFDRDRASYAIKSIDLAGMLSNCHIYGKYTMEADKDNDTGFFLETALPVFNRGDRGNKSSDKAIIDGKPEFFIFDESKARINPEDDGEFNANRWNVVDVFRYLMHQMSYLTSSNTLTNRMYTFWDLTGPQIDIDDPGAILTDAEGSPPENVENERAKSAVLSDYKTLGNSIWQIFNDMAQSGGVSLAIRYDTGEPRITIVPGPEGTTVD